MNEVRVTQTAVQAAVGSSSSSKGQVSTTNSQGGNTLPEQVQNQSTEKSAPQVQTVSVKELISEVALVNDYVQTVQRDLQFKVDEELDRTVIRVVDSDTGELIRQIPDDIFLELARRLKDDGEVNLLNALG